MRTKSEGVATRSRIIRESAFLFAKNGYHGTSTRQIAEQVGILPGSLYSHYTGKDQILWTIVDGMALRFEVAFKPIEESKDNQPARLTAAIQTHLDVLQSDLSASYVLFHERQYLGDDERENIRNRARQYQNMWANIIRAGQQDGSFRKEMDPDIAAIFALSVCRGVVFFGDDDISNEEGRVKVDSEAVVNLIQWGITEGSNLRNPRG